GWPGIQYHLGARREVHGRYAIASGQHVGSRDRIGSRCKRAYALFPFGRRGKVQHDVSAQRSIREGGRECVHCRIGGACESDFTRARYDRVLLHTVGDKARHGGVVLCTVKNVVVVEIVGPLFSRSDRMNSAVEASPSSVKLSYLTTTRPEVIGVHTSCGAVVNCVAPSPELTTCRKNSFTA